jgi:hypothetical protein
MPAKMFSVSLLLCSLFIHQSPTALNAQTIYWKKDYIRDSSGSTIAVATPQPTDTAPPSNRGTPSSSVPKPADSLERNVSSRKDGAVEVWSAEGRVAEMLILLSLQ